MPGPDRWFFNARALSITADLMTTAAVFPLILFSGPTQSDTAYSALPQLSIACLVPLMGKLLGGLAPRRVVNLICSAARLTATATIYSNLGTMLGTASFLTNCLALIWALRLTESNFPDSQLDKAKQFQLSALPFIALIAILGCSTTLQEYLLPSAIVLNSIAIVLLILGLITNRKATAGGISDQEVDGRQHFPGQQKNPSTVTYEIVLAVTAGITLFMPALLVLTDPDQSGSSQTPRAFFNISASSAVAGFLIAKLFDWRGRAIKLPIAHIVLTACLASLLVCKYTTLALVPLALACASAAVIIDSAAISSNRAESARPTWQGAISSVMLAIALYASYIYIQPLQTSWLPIHVLRSLSAITLVTCVAAAIIWARSRIATLQILAHLIPVRRNAPDQSLKSAILQGWSKGAVIVIIKEKTNSLVACVLKLANVYCISHREWLDPHTRMKERMAHTESFIVYDAGDEHGQLVSHPVQREKPNSFAGSLK